MCMLGLEVYTLDTLLPLTSVVLIRQNIYNILNRINQIMLDSDEVSDCLHNRLHNSNVFGNHFLTEGIVFQ